MATIFDTVTSILRPLVLSKEAPKVKIDEWSFRLHYRVTALLLFVFSALICMKEYLGDHIKCVHMQEDDGDDPVIPLKVLETYCFITTTFTVPFDPRTSLYKMSHELSTRLGGPGYIPGKNEQKFHAYYQWVPFYLFLLGLVFCVPHALWKAIDNRKLHHLVQDLNIPELPVDKSVKSRQISLLASYIVRSRGAHKRWAWGYLTCELANLVCLVGCMYLTDVFLGNEFSSYGLEVLKFLEDDPEDRVDPMSRVFPRVTKCNINTYGPSGSIQRFDALCILPSNILNEKIFTFLWFWFLAVAVIATSAYFYRLASLVSIRFRLQSLRVDTSGNVNRVKGVLQILGITDWILLRLLRLNMDEITFDKLIYSIDEQLI